MSTTTFVEDLSTTGRVHRTLAVAPSLAEVQEVVKKYLLLNFSSQQLDAWCNLPDGEGRVEAAQLVFPEGMSIEQLRLQPELQELRRFMTKFAPCPGTWRSVVRELLLERCVSGWSE